MSIHDKFNAIDRAALEKMSTQELKDLLCQMSDHFSATDDESNTILEIVEVLKIRENNSDYIRLDVNAALETFREEFMPSAEIDPMIHNDETDDEDEHSIHILPKKKRHSYAKVAGIAAAIAIVIFTAGCLIPTANGSNLWRAFAHWTKDVLGISTNTTSTREEYPEQLRKLREMLAQNDLSSAGLLPRYIPSGYKETATSCDKLIDETVFLCQLRNNSDIIILQYSYCASEDLEAEFQKNDSEPEVMIIDGHTIYIVQNMNLYSAIWFEGSVQCSIQNVSSHDELIKIIHSIYEE